MSDNRTISTEEAIRILKATWPTHFPGSEEKGVLLVLSIASAIERSYERGRRERAAP